MRVPILVPVLVALSLCVAAATARAADRWAIVLGIAEYQNAAIPALVNTVNDARTMAAALTNMGFAVTLLENAGAEELSAAVTAAGTDHPEAELGLFYFAGHGVQLDGSNYILPADIDPAQPDFVRSQGISVSRTVSQLRDTGISKLVVVLDSCREAPLPGASAYGTGLALVDAPADTIVAYATAPGAVALDGASGNSPYTAALASTLEGPQQDVRDILRLVRAKVRHATGGAQTPWFIDNSSTPIMVQPRRAVSLPAALEEAVEGEVTLEATAWRTIARSSDPTDFERFATMWDGSALADVAREQVSLLRGAGAPDLPRMDLAVPDPNPAVADGLGSLITECDVLATGPGDIFGLSEPVPHDLVNTRAATRACVEAVTLDPESPRLVGLLSRVLQLDERYDEARHYALRAAELGNSSAYGGLAEMYRLGIGVEADPELAVSYAKRGALLGNAPVRTLLGGYYRQGWGVPQSFSEARRWLEIAALTNWPSAVTALGDIYRRGEGVAADPALALRYYNQAAQAGKTDAMNNIGLAYMRGEGVGEDLAQGIHWLARASDEGNAYAPFHLGRAFRTGWGVDRDPRQALAYLRLSAQRNFLGAYIQIGDILTGTDGIPRDAPQAYASYVIAVKAAELRDTIASRKEGAEAQEKLDALVATMTGEEVAAGAELATVWIDQYGLLDFNLVHE